MLGMGSGVSMPPSSEIFYDLGSHSDLQFYFKNNVGLAGVDEWEDQAKSEGMSNNLTQETVDNQGEKIEGGIRFNGSDTYYDLDSQVAIGNEVPYTLFVVMEMSSFDSENAILGRTNAVNQFVSVKSAQSIHIQQTGTATILNDSTRPFATDSRIVLCITKSISRLYKVWVNGDLITFDTTTNNPGLTGDFSCATVGALQEGGSSFDGTIYELGLYTRELSVGEIDSVNSYLINKLL